MINLYIVVSPINMKKKIFFKSLSVYMNHKPIKYLYKREMNSVFKARESSLLGYESQTYKVPS